MPQASTSRIHSRQADRSVNGRIGVVVVTVYAAEETPEGRRSRKIKEPNTLIRMLKADEMMWHPVLLLDSEYNIMAECVGRTCDFL